MYSLYDQERKDYFDKIIIHVPHSDGFRLDNVPKGQGGAVKSKSDGSSTDYYKLPPNATDIIDLIEFKNMNFSMGNIFKACYRIGQKEGNDDAYDLRKIIFFANRELARLGHKVSD